MSFMNLAKERTSVRKFAEKEIENEKLELVLEAGRIAPTAANKQPQRIYVLQSKEALEKLAVLTPCGFNAKTVLIFTYNEEEEFKNPLEAGIHSGVEDVSIVATHMMLEATELGLATCWVNYFANSELEKAFEFPENERSVLIMPIGYAAEDAPMNPSHTVYKEMDEIVRYL